MVELGGLAATLEAMRTFDADAEVQRGGAEVLAWMASSEENEIGNKIASEGGIEVFLKAVRGFPDHEKVLERNLCALGNLACDDDNKVKIAAAGGIEVAIEAMKKHSEVAEVQDNGCFMLGNVASDNPDNQVKIAAAGGIEVAIAEAMKKHPGNEEVQKTGVTCLQIWQQTTRTTK